VSERPALVLVVDDYADGREVFVETLRHTGFRVDEAADGSEALAKAFADPPDVVLMDLSLPVMDGWEATRRLKADPRTRATRVIAVTAHALEAYAHQAREAGADAVVIKPCLPPAVLAEVRRQVQLKRGQP
jgi:CheY-like chemotaxis protein